MKTKVVTATLLLFLGLAAPAAFGQVDVIEDQLVNDEERTKLGQTGMQFLSVSVDPRASALGNAVTAVELNSTAQLYNPASMAFMQPSFDVSLGQNQWITDIKYMYGTAAFRAGNIGTIGINVLSVDHGTVQQTVRTETNEKGYMDLGTIEPSALAVGASYARALTNRFAVGGNVRYVRQDLGSAWLDFGDPSGGIAPNQDQIEKGTAVVDLGVLYRTGFKSLNFAVNVRNFSGEIQYAEQNVELPLNFRMGLSMDLVDFAPQYQDTHSFLMSVDATHPRAYEEQVKVGGEYVFMNTLSLRAGYTYPTDEESVNLGAGLRLPIGDASFGFDYSYTDFGIFDTVHRLGVQMTFE